jgi:XapX domain-containing protein
MSYLISLGVGLVVGVAYALIGVRSPAPPLVALAGLLGMVGGEQLVPLVKHWVVPEKAAVASSSNPASVGSDRMTETP